MMLDGGCSALVLSQLVAVLGGPLQGPEPRFRDKPFLARPSGVVHKQTSTYSLGSSSASPVAVLHSALQPMHACCALVLKAREPCILTRFCQARA